MHVNITKPNILLHIELDLAQTFPSIKKMYISVYQKRIVCFVCLL
jgi:hypothetical protein